MNKVFLIGNLTRDPESGSTQGGINFSKFGIAVNRRFSTAKEVDFFNIVCWRGLADNCNKYLTKGKKVAISGSIQVSNYETKSGEKRTSVDIVAEEVEFLTSQQSSGEGREDYAPTAKRAEDISELKPMQDDELPF
ncbi:MAG: single-stranded DNA-binding protein [Clostridia bacterium]